MTETERVRPVVRVPELADLLGVSVKRAYGMIAEDKVPGVIRLGRRVMLSRAAIERWLLGLEVFPVPTGSSEAASRRLRAKAR